MRWSTENMFLEKKKKTDISAYFLQLCLLHSPQKKCDLKIIKVPIEKKESTCISIYSWILNNLTIFCKYWDWVTDFRASGRHGLVEWERKINQTSSFVQPKHKENFKLTCKHVKMFHIMSLLCNHSNWSVTDVQSRNNELQSWWEKQKLNRTGSMEKIQK